jgi:hypothetical protein
MPITLPVLDDRNYEQILEEALRRIPVYTPEWTNFGIESDPGVTIVQLFAFLTENMLYRANRIPELNRLKFLQLLNVPLLPASPADGLVAIQNERGPIEPLLLEQGVVVAAGNVQFITRDPLNVLPVQVQVYFKRPIADTDPAYATYREKYEGVLAAHLAAQADAEGLPFPGSSEFEALGITPQFYEPVLMPLPKRGEPLPVFDIETTADRSLYLALLAPQNVPVDAARRAIADQVLSIGIAPAISGSVPPLQPLQSGTTQSQGPSLIFESPDLSTSLTRPEARYTRLNIIQQTDVSTTPGLVMIELPSASQLIPWSFDEPLEEGTGDFPPRLEDDQVRERLVAWLRIRLPTAQEDEAVTEKDHRVSWIGINAVRVAQAVPVFNENLGLGNGEPDQAFALANVPVIPASLLVALEETGGAQLVWQNWRLVDDVLSAAPDERVFTLDAESGILRFGDGLRGRRPRGRILASYEYGGGPQGNVAIGAINGSQDARLQSGYKISNPLSTSGGALGETAADGERRIPAVVRHREQLVTLQDFRDITRRTPGVNVGRVEVLPLYLPADPQLKAAGVVTVMVIPRTDSLDPLWPTPDRQFLRRVCNHLDSRRLVTTEIYVRGPEYQPVYISVGIQVRAGFFVDQVQQDAETQLRFYLSSLPPGGSDLQGWPLNKRLVSKDLEAVVTRVPGVEYVESLEMGVQSPQSITDYDLSGLQLPRVVGVSVRQGSAEPLASIFAPVGTAPSLTQTVPIPVSKAKC